MLLHESDFSLDSISSQELSAGPVAVAPIVSDVQPDYEADIESVLESDDTQARTLYLKAEKAKNLPQFSSVQFVPS